MKAVFIKLYPNRGGNIDDFRLKFPCEKCTLAPDDKILEIIGKGEDLRLKALELASKHGYLKCLCDVYRVEAA